MSQCFRDTRLESERLRGRYTLRAMYDHEFNMLWNAQAPYHPNVLTDDLRQAVHEAIFYQRPLRFDPDVIGDCELEIGEKRCPRAHWLGQQFRLLQEINLLETIDPTTGEERRLTGEERQKLIEALTPKKKMTFDQIRDLLGFYETQTFNLEERSKRNYLVGNRVEAALQDRKLAKWYNPMSAEQRQDIWDALADIQDEDQLRTKAGSDWELSETQVERILKINLPIGHFRVSLKAIRKMIPYLEAGHIYSKAKELAGYSLTKEIPVGELLPPVSDALQNLTNPLVHRALSEVRKVVNAIVREYGKPENVVVELARDLKSSAVQRRRIFRENLQRKGENEAIRDRLVSEFNIPAPSRDDIIRYRLWEECGQVCPYTGKPIPKSKLFGADVEVEHILPYSRSLDDSYMNKTLCFADENRNRKHNRTPYEAYHDDLERYDQIRQRIAGLPWPKRRRFTRKQIDLDECVSRQLNDTRYISRVVVQYLRILGRKVGCSRGGVTAALRRQWGLNDLLETSVPSLKTRDDHRHHAVDAAAIALSTPSVLHRLASIRYDPTRPELPPPWEGFRDDLTAAVKGINVSHRPSRKLAGALHEATALGPGGTGRTYVYRVPVERLTAAMVEKIRDPVIRKIVKDRCEKHAIELRGSKAIGRILADPPLCMPSGVPVKRVRIETAQKTALSLKVGDDGKLLKAVLPGGNHHVEIYEKPDGSWTGRVVSRFEAYQRLKNKQPVVCRERADGSHFVMSLCNNDMILLAAGKERTERLYRVQKQSIIEGRPDIVFRVHTAAKIENDQTMCRVGSWAKLQALQPTKVVIDLLGRIRPCND